MISEVDLWPLHAHLNIHETAIQTLPKQSCFPDLMSSNFSAVWVFVTSSWPVTNTAKFLPACVHSWICNYAACPGPSVSLGPLSGNRSPHGQWKSLGVLAWTPRGRPRPSSLQAANERLEPHRPRPFWAARSLIGPSTRCLPAPARGAGSGEWSSGDPSAPALPSLASAPACPQRHLHGPPPPPGGDPGDRTPSRQASTSPTRNGQAQFVIHPNRRRKKSACQGHVSSG